MVLSIAADRIREVAWANRGISTMRSRLVFMVSAAAAAMIVAATAGPAFPTASAVMSELPDSGAPGVNGKVFALASDGTYLYFGGKFSRVIDPTTGKNLETADNVARINESTMVVDKTFHPVVTRSAGGAYVHGLFVFGDNLYIAGSFDSVDGNPLQNVAAVSTVNGSVDTEFAPRTNGRMHAVLATARGVYFGGKFSRVDGSDRNNAAAVAAADGSILPWDPNLDSTVRNLVSDGTSIWASGHFTTVAGSPCQSLARLDPTTGASTGWCPDNSVVPPMTAWDVDPQPSAIYGGFGRKLNFVASFDPVTGVHNWKEGTAGNVESVAYADSSRLFLSGHIGTAKGLNPCGSGFLHGVLFADPTTGKFDCSWLPHLRPDQKNFTGGWTLLITNDGGIKHLWLGGSFTTISTQDDSQIVPTGSLARWTI
jgi:hypothetical protein